jgi:hypothetical protein
MLKLRFTFFTKELTTMANTTLTTITSVISVIVQAPGTVFTSLIFFVTYEMDPISSSVHYTGLERLAVDKQSNLLGQLLSYEEN